jgi:hypothetical protein
MRKAIIILWPSRKSLVRKKVHADFLNLCMTPISKTEPSIDALFISSAYTTTLLVQMTVSDCILSVFEASTRLSSVTFQQKRGEISRLLYRPETHRGRRSEGIQSTQRIDTPQLADKVKVEDFTGFSQYVCRLDIDAEGFYS